MKKTAKLFGIAALVAAMATISTTGAFAQVPLSFGVGSSLISGFGGGVSGRVTEAGDVVPFRLGNEVYRHESYTGRASSIFFDAHFVQLSLGYFSGTSATRSRSSASNPGVAAPTVTGSAGRSGIEIGLLGKFPVGLSDRVTVFPLGGIAYRLVLTGTPMPPIDLGGGNNNLSLNPFYLSALWFRLGGGMDFALTQGVFLRSTITYGIRLRNRWENDVINHAPFENGPVGDARWLINYDSARLGHGVDITVGVGFRLR